jgi:ABC-type nitrate/sulfonate/bicarbonate transport system substrate-binding protein
VSSKLLPRATRSLAWLLFAFAALACSKSEGSGARELETDVLRFQAYPTIVGPTEVAAELGFLAPLKLEYTGSTISGPQNIQAVATGDIDYGGAFNGAVVKLIGSKVPVRAVMAYYGTSASSYSGFYVLPDSPIKGARDLIGKKIAVNTLGAHSEFVIREYLARGGLSADQIKQVQMVVMPPGSSEQSLRDRHVEVAAMQTVLYEKALARGELRLLFSDHQLFGDFNAGSYVMREDFIKKNPNAVRHFVQASARAIDWLDSHPREEVIPVLERAMRRRGEHEDLTQLQYWKGSTVATRGGVMGDRDFQVWIDWLVKDGQLRPGQVEPKQIYTNEFQDKPAPLAARTENR